MEEVGVLRRKHCVLAAVVELGDDVDIGMRAPVGQHQEESSAVDVLDKAEGHSFCRRRLGLAGCSGHLVG